MPEDVAPRAGRRSGLIIGAIAVIVLLALIFFYWMGAWRGSGGALDEHDTHDPRLEQQQPATQTP